MGMLRCICGNILSDTCGNDAYIFTQDQMDKNECYDSIQHMLNSISQKTENSINFLKLSKVYYLTRKRKMGNGIEL